MVPNQTGNIGIVFHNKDAWLHKRIVAVRAPISSFCNLIETIAAPE
jgi:hypothetical protein